MKDESDADLLAAWVDGDTERGEALFERHFSSLFRFFASKVPADAGDLTQETMLACVEGARKRTPVDDFRAYMFGVARNRLARLFRTRAHPHTDFSAHSIADLSPGPSTLLSADERRSILLRAMAALPVDQQITLELYYWEGFGTDAIAEITEVSAGTVRSRLDRARSALRKAIPRLEARRPKDGTDLETALKQLGRALAGD